MKIFKDIKKKADKVEKEVDMPPVTVEAVEQMIQLLKISKDIGCLFELCLTFKDDDFIIKSADFQDVELLKKTKARPESLLISYKTSLLLYQTTVKIEDIKEISLSVKYHSQGDS